MQEGTVIDYRISLLGIPFRWRTLIQQWRQQSHFVDSQIKGPYKTWIHTHSFHANEEGVVVRDSVRYQVPGWILEPLIHRMFVAPQIRSIFEYRTQVLCQLLEKQAG